MDVADGQGLVAKLQEEFAVTGFSDYVAFMALEQAGEDAHALVALGIMADGMIHDLDERRLLNDHPHEWLHLAVGNDGGLVCGRILDKMQIEIVRLEVSLDVVWGALEEDEAADGEI